MRPWLIKVCALLSPVLCKRATTVSSVVQPFGDSNFHAMPPHGGATAPLCPSFPYKRPPPSWDVTSDGTLKLPHTLTMLQLALLAALANLAIAVVSAQDPVVFNTSSPVFGGSLTNCGTSGPVSCGDDGDSSEVDLCCYESPGVSCIRCLPVSWCCAQLTHV